MVQLGRHFGTGPASLAEIAAEEDLPRAYLEQLVISLRDAGLVASTRGAHGGYELTRNPGEIRMGEILRALEDLRPQLSLHRQHPVGSRPRRRHRRPRRHDPGRPRAAARFDRRRPDRDARFARDPRPNHSDWSPDLIVTAQTTATNPSAAGSADDTLVIRGLRVAPIADREHEILQGIDLDVGKGEVHAIMGPNGSGKTTLAYALMGHPSYVVTGGEVHWKGRDILKLSPDKRSRLGMFLAFQYPTAIPGLSVASFIRSALNAKLLGIDKTGDVDPTDPQKGGISMRDFRNKMREKMAILKMDEGFAARYVNEGFSGGEKKRLEMLQMAVLEPEIAILDETDSGLDIDALRIVAEGVNAMLNPDLGVLLITHYQRLLNYITPDQVHVLAQGRIIKSGGKDLALRLEDEGYGPILREAGLSPDAPDEALLVPQAPAGADPEPVEAAR